MSGTLAYDFALNNSIYKNMPAGVYLVTYWSATACAVNGAAPISIGPANAKGLKLHTHQVTVPTGQQVYVNSSNAKIDELRIMPKDAMVKTIAYDPSGQVSTEINERDDVVSYEFDGLQRLKLVRDKENRILRQFAYDLDKGGGLSPTLPVTFYNAYSSVTLKRNNCTSTDYGTEMTYTVPGRTYMSFVSQSAADAAAAADIAANSQNYANTYGECRPKTEVVWQPYGMYCQTSLDYGHVPQKSDYSVVQVWTEPGTDNVTKFRIYRDSKEWRYGATVKLVIHFAGGGYTDMPVTIGFLRDSHVDYEGTIMMSPQQTSYRNGMSIVSVERVPHLFATGWRIYGQRRKRVGGEVVLVEPNQQNVGQGPYYPPYEAQLPAIFL